MITLSSNTLLEINIVIGEIMEWIHIIIYHIVDILCDGTMSVSQL